MTANWNPSPPDSPSRTSDSVPSPSATADYNDTIGDTVFSKSWVLSLLVQAVATVQENTPGNEVRYSRLQRLIAISKRHKYECDK